MTETGKHVLTQNPYNLIWDSINPYEFTGKFSLHVLDLSYISKVTDDVKNSSLYHWACLFKATTWKEMLAMAEQSESIKKAVVTLLQLTNDEKIPTADQIFLIPRWGFSVIFSEALNPFPRTSHRSSFFPHPSRPLCSLPVLLLIH